MMWRAKRTPPRPRPRLVPIFTAECLDEAVDRVSPPPPRPVHPHAAAHEDNCGYQFEQYPFECTCGAAGFLITWIGGNCPVQAEGTIDGEPFYFRARGSRWSIEVGDWEHSEACMKWPEAGWMSETMVLMLISRSVALYRARTADSTATDPWEAADKLLISQLCGPAGRVVPGNQGG